MNRPRSSGLDPDRDPRQPTGGRPDDIETEKQRWPGRTKDMEPVPDHGESSYRGASKLVGQRALITGGDSGIGRAVAIAFAREGADVVIGYYDEHEDAEDTLTWIERAERKGAAIAADLTAPEECRRLVSEAVKLMGGIDILVNNAAYQMEQSDISKLTAEQVDRTFRTNIYAYIFMAQAALERMDAGDVIINTGSVTALRGNPGLLDYSATKGAIHAFTRSLSLAVAERGIRVNCVAPGPVWTPLIPSTLKQDHLERFGEDTHWGRVAQPAEIAPTYVFLASADSRYYTGDVMAPTGGETSR